MAGDFSLFHLNMKKLALISYFLALALTAKAERPQVHA
jgi:hypothetical protein